MTVEIDTDWDIDQYYDDTEPDDHWNLRKNFMIAHKDKFEEEYLVALARTFANIELLGCRYPLPLQRRIAELSKDVAKDYRSKKEGKLQRSFVAASSAAETRITGKKAK